jgi:hypothetical protein
MTLAAEEDDFKVHRSLVLLLTLSGIGISVISSCRMWKGDVAPGM